MEKARDRNRRIILEAARAVLLADPEATLGDVAARAGVVRRTVYGHFAGRRELVVALIRIAAEEFLEPAGRLRTDTADPAAELALAVLHTWGTARRHGPLVMLARQAMDDEVRAAMAPFVDAMRALVAHGQGRGTFTAHADARVLVELLDSGSDAYLRAAEGGWWDGDETDVAYGHLLTLGVAPDEARAAVARAAARR